MHTSGSGFRPCLDHLQPLLQPVCQSESSNNCAEWAGCVTPRAAAAVAAGMVDLKGKVALVTGATSGIGQVTAEYLAGEGCPLCCVGVLGQHTAKCVCVCASLASIGLGAPNCNCVSGLRLHVCVCRAWC